MADPKYGSSSRADYEAEIARVNAQADLFKAKGSQIKPLDEVEQAYQRHAEGNIRDRGKASTVIEQGALLYVLDYEAMGRKGVQPRRLHRTDCPHPYPQSAWRKATQEELRTLSPCKDCQNRE